MGSIITAFSMSISGMTFALTKGWSFTLVILGVFPLIGILTSLLTKIVQGGFKESTKAYG
jgi:hypothetical protein